jgi:predicted DNA-binding protein
LYSTERNEMDVKIPFTVRITPEAAAKLKIISAYTRKPMGTILTELIEELWEKESDKMSGISTQKITRAVKKTFKSI